LADKQRKGPHDDNVVVIGLGRFGGQVAESLQNLGHEVSASTPIRGSCRTGRTG
jgi:Trk K+ transport system NAD-binding subunit